MNSRGESINHVCIFDEHQVQPTTSPLPACGHTHLLPSALQKLTDVLQTTDCDSSSDAARAPLGGAIYTFHILNDYTHLRPYLNMNV